MEDQPVPDCIVDEARLYLNALFQAWLTPHLESPLEIEQKGNRNKGEGHNGTRSLRHTNSRVDDEQGWVELHFL